MPLPGSGWGGGGYFVVGLGCSADCAMSRCVSAVQLAHLHMAPGKPHNTNHWVCHPSFAGTLSFGGAAFLRPSHFLGKNACLLFLESTRAAGVTAGRPATEVRGRQDLPIRQSHSAPTSKWLAGDEPMLGTRKLVHLPGPKEQVCTGTIGREGVLRKDRRACAVLGLKKEGCSMEAVQGAAPDISRGKAMHTHTPNDYFAGSEGPASHPSDERVYCTWATHTNTGPFCFS